MKTQAKLFFCFLFFLPLFLVAQSPQCVNFTNWGYTGYSTAIQGNTIWFTASGALVKMDKTTGVQTVYKPDNSNMLGMQQLTVAISPSGVLWGGGSNGFWKFDGTNFTNYPTTTNGDTIRHIYDIQWDLTGNMYLLASFYLNFSVSDIIKYNGLTIERLSHPYVPFTSNALQNTMCVLDNGEIYLSYAGNVLNSYLHYNGIIWDTLALPTNNTHIFVKNTNQEIIAIPTSLTVNNNSIYKLSGNAWIPISCTWTTPPPTFMYIFAAIIDNNNDIYLSSKSQLVKISGNNLTSYNYINLPFSSSINGLTKDGNGDIWMNYTATPQYQQWSHKIVKYSNGQWTSFIFKPDIELGYWLYIDSFNRKWAYGFDQGLQFFSGTQWQTFPLPPGRTVSGSPSPLTVDTYGNIWLMTDSINVQSNSYRTLYKYDGAWHFIHANCPGGAIAVDKSGRICAVNSGFHYFNGISWQNINTNIPYIGQPVSVAVDSSNLFWIVTDNGELVTFDGTTFLLKPFSVTSAISGVITRFDDANRLWIMNTGAVNVVSGNNHIEYSKNTIPSLGNAITLSGCRDLNGNDWISTDKGLFKKSGNSWISYSVYNTKIAENRGLFMFVDNANNIWFATNSSITVFNESGIIKNSLQSSMISATGNIYHDLNNNGQKDTLEYNLPAQKVFVQPDNINRHSDTNGDYYYYPTTGNHSLAIIPYNNWQLTSDSALYHVQGGVSRDSLDFGLKATTIQDSISVALYASQTRCSWQVPYWLSYQNKGTTTLSGSIILTIDSLTSNLIAFPPANASATFTYTWNFQNLKPFETRNIDISMAMPNFSSMGAPIETNVVVTSPNCTANALHIDTLGCSFDPNDKTTFLPSGSFQGNEVLNNTAFTYMIRFQNTGNDVAFNVTIQDTLDNYWDMSSFEVLESSHPMLADYLPNGIVRFQFPNIMLPDSGTNEVASHGFVAYKVKPKTTIPDYTVLQNTAFIYFDSNPAVVTNTTSHTIVSAFTGIAAGNEFNALKWYPNPMHEVGILTYTNPKKENYTFTLSDINGKKIFQTQNNGDKIELNCKGWSAGLYIFSLTNDRKTMRGKWLKTE